MPSGTDMAFLFRTRGLGAIGRGGGRGRDAATGVEQAARDRLDFLHCKFTHMINSL